MLADIIIRGMKALVCDDRLSGDRVSVVQGTGQGGGQTWIHMPALPLITRMTCDQLTALNFSFLVHEIGKTNTGLL